MGTLYTIPEKSEAENRRLSDVTALGLPLPLPETGKCRPAGSLSRSRIFILDNRMTARVGYRHLARAADELAAVYVVSP